MNDYFENYRSLKEEVDDVCLVISNKSCTKLKDEVCELKNNFENLLSEDIWSDKVGDVFKKIVSKCSSKLKEITISIENNFIKSEELYKKLKEKLDLLQKLNKDYQESYKNASSFVEVTNKKTTKSTVLDEIEKVKKLELEINNTINDIESIKQELILINNNQKYIEETNVINEFDNVENKNLFIEPKVETISNKTVISIDSDKSVIELANMCMAEQGSPEGAKFELSLLINQFKSVYGREPTSASELSDFMQNFGYGGGHWYAARTRNMASLPTAGQSYINAMHEVLNGNRVLPSNVVEHDCFSDIAKIVVNGRTITDYNEIKNHANYIKDNTVIYNKMGSVYTFYEFAPNGGDPFGYFK